ncbi:PAS domain S-box protein [Methanoregula formicica]|uniref:histidine kinase n=1 Tax=Methanoregula formicica (strain DSM 22288 / NBRC 105244 / SMSP) TaxID=593750 RepID=L0HGK7_METFS|nr:PAS domain S-box protein [Methanoregula formicica]AGB03145.1 PAS domain S-box [Methanoregula formicica SMSP]
MKLQEKTSVILITLLIVILALIVLFVANISLTSYSALEQRYVTQDVDMALSRLDAEYNALSTVTTDWGQWDDTYEFVNGRNPGYVSTNIVPGIFRNLQVSFIVITNENGEVVYAGAYDTMNHTMIPVTESLFPYLVPGSPLLKTSEPLKTTSGIIILDDRPVIVASCPILHSDLSGNPTGSVVMGRYLDHSVTVVPLTSVQQQFRLLPADDPGIPASVRALLAAAGDNNARTTEFVGDNEIAGYALIRDITGQGRLIVEVREPRTIYLQGATTTIQYVLIVLAAGLMLGITYLLLLDRLVLSRITSLSTQVQGISTKSLPSRRVHLEGNDEFAALAREINGMLDSLDEASKGLIRSEARFHELADLLPLPIFEMDADCRVLYTNKVGAELFGISDEMIRKDIRVGDFLIEGEGERMRRGLNAVLSGGTSTGEIYTLRKTDGTLMRAIISLAPIHREGQVIGFRGVLIDVTERVNLEEALIESQEYLQTLLMSVSIGILVIDAGTHTIIDVNPAALEMIGITRDEIIGRSCHDVVCPAEAGKCPVTDLGIQVDNSQRILVRSDGSRISIIKHVVPVMLHGRSCLLETFIDNTVRLQMQEELQKSQERLSHLLQTSPVGVFESKASGALTYVNERWEEMTGMTFQDMRSRPWKEIQEPLDRMRISKEMWKKFQSRLLPDAETRFMRPDGSVIWLYGQSVPVYDSKGQIHGYVGTITDITDRKRIEDAIHLANKKLNLMNDITRHDILNTITGIFGLIDMAVASGNKEELARLLEQIKEEGRLIQRQITFTRDYQGVGVHAPVWQNVRDIVSRAISGLNNPGVSIEIELEETEIFADPLLEKVFYNLADNAVRYGERLTMIRFYYQISDIGLTLICEDDGVGIPDNAKARIFERGVGRNTGMGLFLTREILRITGISIRETGVYGKRARFELIIPNGTWRFVKKERKE